MPRVTGNDVDAAVSVFKEINRLMSGHASYEEYEEYVSRFDRMKWKETGLGTMSRGEYTRLTDEGIPFIDGESLWEEVDVPVLALFGEKDKNIDPVKNARKFEEIFAGSDRLTIQTFNNADHGIFISETGSAEEMEVNFLIALLNDFSLQLYQVNGAVVKKD